MKVHYIFLALLLSACSSNRKYEEIIIEAFEDYQTDAITHYVNSWVPFDYPEDLAIINELKQKSDIDYNFCIDEYKGQLFESEADAVVFFMQCMNKKGWRLHSEKLIIISH